MKMIIFVLGYQVTLFTLPHDVCYTVSCGRFKTTYEILNITALKCSLVNKIYIFPCMGKISCVEFQRYALKFHTKYLAHTWKMRFLYNIEILKDLGFKSSYAFFKRPLFTWKYLIPTEHPWHNKITKPCCVSRQWVNDLNSYVFRQETRKMAHTRQCAVPVIELLGSRVWLIMVFA